MNTTPPLFVRQPRYWRRYASEAELLAYCMKHAQAADTLFYDCWRQDAVRKTTYCIACPHGEHVVLRLTDENECANFPELDDLNRWSERECAGLVATCCAAREQQL